MKFPNWINLITKFLIVRPPSFLFPQPIDQGRDSWNLPQIQNGFRPLWLLARLLYSIRFRINHRGLVQQKPWHLRSNSKKFETAFSHQSLFHFFLSWQNDIQLPTISNLAKYYSFTTQHYDYTFPKKYSHIFLPFLKCMIDWFWIFSHFFYVLWFWYKENTTTQ